MLCIVLCLPHPGKAMKSTSEVYFTKEFCMTKLMQAGNATEERQHILGGIFHSFVRSE